MIRAALFILVMSSAAPAFAKDFGVDGNTFEIAETPIYDFIRDKLRVAEKEGRLDELNQSFARNSVKRINRPKPVYGLRETEEAASHLFDPSITITQDLADHEGTVFAQARSVINPMDYTALTHVMLFIDGDKPAQVDWALSEYDRLEKRAKIILVSGEPIELMKKRKVRFYFDQGGNISKRFELSKIPARIEQEGRLLRITEVPVDDQ